MRALDVKPEPRVDAWDMEHVVARKAANLGADLKVFEANGAL